MLLLHTQYTQLYIEIISVLLIWEGISKLIDLYYFKKDETLSGQAFKKDEPLSEQAFNSTKRINTIRSIIISLIGTILFIWNTNRKILN